MVQESRLVDQQVPVAGRLHGRRADRLRKSMPLGAAVSYHVPNERMDRNADATPGGVARRSGQIALLATAWPLQRSGPKRTANAPERLRSPPTNLGQASTNLCLPTPSCCCGPRSIHHDRIRIATVAD